MSSFVEYMLGNLANPANPTNVLVSNTSNEISPYLRDQLNFGQKEGYVKGNDFNQQFASLLDYYKSRGIDPYAPVPEQTPQNSWLHLNKYAPPSPDVFSLANANPDLLTKIPTMAGVANQQADYYQRNPQTPAAPPSPLYGGWSPPAYAPFMPQYQPLNIMPQQPMPQAPMQQSAGYGGSMPGFSAGSLMSPINPFSSNSMYTGMLPKF